MKNLSKTYFERLDFIPKLLKYFALSPNNRVTVPGCFDNVSITFYQDDDGKYHRIVDNGDSVPIDLTYREEIELHTILAIISHLGTLPPTMKECAFNNMEDQVRAMSTAYFTFGDF